ncbi:MAG: GTP-binding protein [Candidatus Spyradocola sp.]
MNIRNIGILAHVDAGKTTVTERILHRCGSVKTAGSVDEGTAHTDTLAVERARGISVKAAAASCEWQGVSITILDTPGHADFAAEVERSIWALDGAVLVVSAAEGVQAQTEIYYNALRAAGIPVVFFINKVDRIGADRERTLAQLRGLLGAPAVALWNSEALIEAVCETDDALLAAYLDGEEPSNAALEAALARAATGCALCPVLSGAALRGEGIEDLLDAIVKYLPPPAQGQGDALCGVVFAVTPDKVMGRAAHVRLFSGSLSNRQTVGEHKITQIRALRGTKYEDKGELRAGEVGVVYGLEGVRAGDVLGERALLPPGRLNGGFAQPLLSARVLPEKEQDLRALKAALEELSAEDPHLNASWSPFTHELYVHLMGSIQTEILTTLIEERFGLRCTFDPPTVMYKETIAHEAEGFVAYTMPKPCWAIMNFRLTPLPQGSGVRFRITAPPTAIKPRYLKQVEQTIPRALEQGMLGWEVTDVDIELYDGSDHQWHTHPLDFALATPMGIMDGLQRGGPVLLEPILRCRFTVPGASAGRLMSDLATMRARFDAPVARGDMMVLEAMVPAATSLDYPVQLAAYTGGRGAMVTQLAGYEPVALELGATCPRRGVHPLDTAKYILAARKALEGDVWG